MVVAAGYGKVGVGRTHEIVIVSGNRGYIVQRDCLRKGSAQIRVGRAPIANEPTGVDIEVHEVREPRLARRSCSGASLQGLKLGEVNRLRSAGLEIGIDEVGVA